MYGYKDEYAGYRLVSRKNKWVKQRNIRPDLVIAVVATAITLCLFFIY